ncbi:MAG: D-alanyl-D-alanine carboxypeptidase family protein [Ruminococcaceae bacterium]|nr:D-alanyl-D-alanine carboxypeptidase family protein [Oscillospiraceae bacterium]
MNYGQNRSYGGRSRRRRRQRMMKTILLSFIVVLLVAGTAILLVSLKRISEREENRETSPLTDTVDTSAQTTPEDTAGGVLKEGFITKKFTPEELHRGDLILVRAGAPYVFPEKMNLQDLYTGRKKYDNGARAFQISTADLELDSFVLSKLNEMTETFYETTGERGLLVKSAFRSEESQKELFDYRVERDGEKEALKYVARPGESEHHTAMAFDMSVYKDGANTYISDEEEYLWIYENAHKYGFILRYPEEKADITGIAYEAWHFRYVGVPHAYYIYKEGLVLEEYIELLRNEHAYDDIHLTVESDDGISYEIYYVPASESGDTDIILPSGYEYTVSGNNTDGFIVTVKLS